MTSADPLPTAPASARGAGQRARRLPAGRGRALPGIAAGRRAGRARIMAERAVADRKLARDLRAS